ncbi:hypothetical protein D3C73_1276390 [compost metagenome]
MSRRKKPDIAPGLVLRCLLKLPAETVRVHEGNVVVKAVKVGCWLWCRLRRLLLSWRALLPWRLLAGCLAAALVVRIAALLLVLRAAA